MKFTTEQIKEITANIEQKCLEATLEKLQGLSLGGKMSLAEFATRTIERAIIYNTDYDKTARETIKKAMHERISNMPNDDFKNLLVKRLLERE
jgi:hypothetical protein